MQKMVWIYHHFIHLFLVEIFYHQINQRKLKNSLEVMDVVKLKYVMGQVMPNQAVQVQILLG